MRMNFKRARQITLWALIPFVFLLLFGADRSAQYLDGFGANIERAQDGALIFRWSKVLGFFIVLRFAYPRWITAALLGLILLGLPLLGENKIHAELVHLSGLSLFSAVAFILSSLSIGLTLIFKSYKEYHEELSPK